MNKRQKEVIEHQLTMEKAVLDALEKEYRAALKDINLKIKMLQSDELTQSKIYHIQYQKTLKKQVEAAIEKLHSDEYSTIQQYLSESYTDAFVGTMYDVHGQGVPVIAPIDQNAAIKAVLTDSKLSKPLYDSLGVDVNKLKKNISQEISRGIASGLMYNEIARNIEFFTNAPLSRAKTIVRTEAHRIQEASANDARELAKSKGADVIKQWDATLDGNTRPTHRELDGQIRELEEYFEANGKKAKYPGEFGDPAEDCNCRCVALTRARWALDEDELETLKERAKFFDLDKSGDFDAFKKKYMKAAETVVREETEAKAVVPIKDAIDFEYGNYTTDDYNKWWDDYEELNKDVKLSAKELEVIENYTEGSFVGINGVSRGDIEALRKKGYTDADISEAIKNAEILEKSLHKFKLDTNIVTHRFERDVSWLTGTDNSVAALKNMVGQQYSAKGFTSSGMSANRARFTGGKSDAVHFEIVTPKGTDGAFLYMSKKGENEFLYNRNTKFVVLDGGERVVKEAKFNIKTMQMEMVDVKERFLKVQVVLDKPKENAQTAKATTKVAVKDAAKVITGKAAKKPAKKQSTVAFTPAKTIEEAEGYAQRFVEKYKSKYTGDVSYKNLDLEYANALNRTMTEVFDKYETKYPIRNIKPFNFREKRFKDTQAEAAYQWGVGDLFYNPKFYKSKKTFADYQKQVDELMEKCLGIVDEALAKKDMKPEKRKFWEAMKASGVQCFSQKTDDHVGGTFVHEFGHYLDDNLFMKAFKEKGIDVSASQERYATRISAYATTTRHEYIAEAFSAFWYGYEDLLDPDLVSVFKETMKK